MGRNTGEQRRLAALQRLDILHSRAEAAFDRIADLAARLFEVPIAAIHLIDDRRQWVKAAHGQSLDELPREQTLCQHPLQQDDVVVIPDTTVDARSRELWYVTGKPEIRFYAGAPLRTREGAVVGTLCLMDTRPRAPLDEAQTALLRQLADLVVETMEMRVAHRQAHSAVVSAVEEDALTGLLNHRGVIHRLRERLGSEAGIRETVVLEVRLDRLETLQRAHGWTTRNEVLRQAAERLAGGRDGTEIQARTGGDTFLLIRSFPDTEDASAWADARTSDLLALLREPFVTGNEVFHLSASVGVASHPRDAATPFQLLDAADEAAGEAQDAGGDRVARYRVEHAASHRHRLSIEARLRRTLANGGLEVAYQPIVDIGGPARVVGAEALARWPQPEGNPIGPEVFIPVAEAAGLIGPLGRWVFERSCEQLAQWHADDRRLWLSVNISPMQLANAALADELTATAERAGLRPDTIKLEITESALVADDATVARVLTELREAGFTLALDDFGTGHSSLARLLRMPFHVLKVDRGFVIDCPGGPGAAVVSSLAAFSSRLGIQALGEGVETQAQETFLRDHGYRLAQGYRYAPPLSAADFAAYCGSADPAGGAA